MATARRNGHRRAHGKRAWLGAACKGIICVALIGGTGYACCRYVEVSEHYRVKTIRVEGAQVLDADTIVAESGLTDKDNILFVNVGQVRRRIEAMPYVKTCRVTRMFPDLVALTIEERVAVACLLVRDQVFEIDAEGYVLRALCSGVSSPLPLISELPGVDAVLPGEQITAPALAEALEVCRAFPTTSVSQRVGISEIAAFHENDVRMYCDGLPYEIRWGYGDAFEQAQRLDLLWTVKNGDIGAREYVDLRFGKDVVCK